MLSHKIAKKIKPYFYYGWIIVFISGVSMFFSAPGQSFSISTFINYYIEDFGYSRTYISFIYSLATVLSGSLLFFVGRHIDFLGQRKMSFILGFCLAAACLFNSFIANVAMLFIGFFLLRYLGQGSMMLIPNALIPQWFDKKRAFAVSIATLGIILANVVVPPMNIYFIQTQGWEITWRFWSIAIILIFIPLSYFFMINNPEDVHLLPDNAPVSSHQDLLDEMEKVDRESFTLKETLHTKEFWFIGIISMIVPMITTGIMFHFFSIMDLQGIKEEAAAFAIGLISLPGFFMPLISGLIIDRFRSKYIVAITLTVVALDMLFMLIVSNIAMAVIFMLVYGLATNIQNLTLNIIWVKYFGRKYLGSIRGAATVFGVLGSAFGTIPFGLSYDLTGSYVAVFTVMAIITFAALGMALSIKRPKRA